MYFHDLYLQGGCTKLGDFFYSSQFLSYMVSNQAGLFLSAYHSASCALDSDDIKDNYNPQNLTCMFQKPPKVPQGPPIVLKKPKSSPMTPDPYADPPECSPLTPKCPQGHPIVLKKPKSSRMTPDPNPDSPECSPRTPQCPH
jgi:hypothetical protein